MLTNTQRAYLASMNYRQTQRGHLSRSYGHTDSQRPFSSR